MNIHILGGTGAIGAAITNHMSQLAAVTILNSKNCNLNSDGDLPDFSNAKCDVLVNASGTFGGLKSYEKGAPLLPTQYLKNLSTLIRQLQPYTIINISSAAVSNYENHQKSSTYYDYVNIKKLIEQQISAETAQSTIHLRCTNIISQFEDYSRSGHSIASIFRNFLNAKNKVSIWSHPDDWREYLDADDLAQLIPSCIELDGEHTLNVGSGHKSYMSDIISSFKNMLNFQGDILFTQPNKPGPLNNIVGIPMLFDRNHDLQTTSTSQSIHKCISRWTKEKNIQ